MRSFVKSAVALLPWKLRKLVMFFVEHGLVSRPPFSGVYASFEDMLGTIKVAEDDQAAGAREMSRAAQAGTKQPNYRVCGAHVHCCRW
jgi:hypothetical protein